MSKADELAERASDEADLCRNDGADDIAQLLDEVSAHLRALDASHQRLIEIVRVTIGNIKSLGPAGALEGVQPYTEYREWLAQLEAAYARATGSPQ